MRHVAVALGAAYYGNLVWGEKLGVRALAEVAPRPSFVPVSEVPMTAAASPSAIAAGAPPWPTICPYCGSKVQAGTATCMHCGFGLQAGQGTEPIVCTNPACGAVNPPHERNCQRCGKPLPGTISSIAPVTPHEVGTDERHCPYCSELIRASARKCKHCGEFLDEHRPHPMRSRKGPRRKLSTALLLVYFLGIFGAHRFYVGKWGTGLLVLLLSLTIYGLLVTIIWAIVDFINIARGNFNDAENQPLVPPGSDRYEPVSVKKTSTALLLNVFLGTFGIHRFYVEKWGTAVIMLVISFTLYGFLVTIIWSIVDFIALAQGHFEDAEGRPLAWNENRAVDSF